jgi:acylphosphatase
MADERLAASVRGMVQGVGFRYFVVQEARQLALTGYVANKYDGSVDVVAEGPRDRLESFLGLIRRGPRASVVKDVVVHWDEATGEFTRFDVAF